MPTEIGTKLVTARFGDDGARTLAGYEKSAGTRSCARRSRCAPKTSRTRSRLRTCAGRGGAGFCHRREVGLCPKDAKQVHLVCNADESEPGTCKDRELMYWDPHLLIEGMIIAAHALKAVHNYILHPRAR